MKIIKYITIKIETSLNKNNYKLNIFNKIKDTKILISIFKIFNNISNIYIYDVIDSIIVWELVQLLICEPIIFSIQWSASFQNHWVNQSKVESKFKPPSSYAQNPKKSQSLCPQKYIKDGQRTLPTLNLFWYSYIVIMGRKSSSVKVLDVGSWVELSQRDCLWWMWFWDKRLTKCVCNLTCNIVFSRKQFIWK